MLLLSLLILSIVVLSKSDDDTPKPCNGGLGECVPFYLCKDGKISTDGADILDIRFDEGNECVDYFEECCATGDILPMPPPTEKPPISLTCGLRNAQGIGFKITGNNDHEAEYGEFPWMMAILKEEIINGQKISVYQCGGSLIASNVVLTAAHCVDGIGANKLIIRAGEWDTQTKNELYPHTDHLVSEVIKHERYSKKDLRNDIALIFLKDSVQLAQHVNTACLPPQNYSIGRKRCFVSGWGKDQFGEEGKYQAILKKLELPTVPYAKCQESLRKTRLGPDFKLLGTFMCAGGESDKAACKGDGGSPLVCPVVGKPGHFFQVGIVAWGIGCGEASVPGVYVNVGKFRTWIDDKLTLKKIPSISYTLKVNEGPLIDIFK